MTDRKFSRRRRGGMRFRPSKGQQRGGPQPPAHRESQQARAAALKPDTSGPEPVFDQSRVKKEIDRAENMAFIEELGVPFEEHVQRVLDAMKSIAEDLGLGGQ